MIINILLIAATTVLDRLRGQGKLPKGLMQVCYGLAIGCYLHLDVLFVVLFTLAFVAGISPGWGNPIGSYIAGRDMEPSKNEIWQYGIFEKNVFLAVVLRGMIWAAPIAILSIKYPEAKPAIPAIIIAFPLAATIAKLLLKRTIKAWEYHELIRGFLVGLLVVLFKEQATS